MNKYTTNKLFEKTFNNPIWKIEVDSKNNIIALETRNPEDTLPSFHILDFQGCILLENYMVEEKEWTLATIQNNYLILKKVGISTPIQAGIKIIDIEKKEMHIEYAEYVIKEVYNGTIEALHRSIPNGLLFYINIISGKVQNTKPNDVEKIDNMISYPQTYKGKLPRFMCNIEKNENIWIQPYNKGFIWTYLEKKSKAQTLNLILSTKDQIINKETIFYDFNGLILHPYFEVKGHIFFLSDTKQRIVSYLV